MVGGSVDAALAVAQVWAEPGVGHARAASVGLGQVVQDAADAGDHVGDRRDVGRVFGVDEGGALLVAEAESPCRSRCVGVVDGHETGDRLLLEPLEGVPGSDAGDGGQLVGGDAARCGDAAVETQPTPEVDAEHLERGHGGLEDPVVEGGGVVGVEVDDRACGGRGIGQIGEGAGGLVRCHG